MPAKSSTNSVGALPGAAGERDEHAAALARLVEPAHLERERLARGRGRVERHAQRRALVVRAFPRRDGSRAPAAGERVGDEDERDGDQQAAH